MTREIYSRSDLSVYSSAFIEPGGVVERGRLSHIGMWQSVAAFQKSEGSLIVCFSSRGLQISR